MGTHPIFESDFDCLTGFQNELKEKLVDLKDFTRENAREFFQNYLHRFDDEINEIELRNIELKRKTQSNSSRIDAMKDAVLKERMLLNSTGLDGPNLFNFKSLEAWLEWDGDLDGMPRLKTKLWTVGNLEIESIDEL